MNETETVELVHAVSDNARRLGLTWTLQTGTIVAYSPMQAKIDLADTAVPVTPLIRGLRVDDRVVIIAVPPAGQYVVGHANPDPVNGDLAPAVNLNTAGTVGSTTSATYANIPGLPFVSLAKRYDSTRTGILLSFTGGAFTSAVNTSVGIGINLTGGVGTDVDITVAFINAANTHVYFASNKILTGLSAGTYTLVGRWKRTAGGGTLQMDANDSISITAQEVWTA